MILCAIRAGLPHQQRWATSSLRFIVAHSAKLAKGEKGNSGLTAHLAVVLPRDRNIIDPRPWTAAFLSIGVVVTAIETLKSDSR
jgi:hypothetical protein